MTVEGADTEGQTNDCSAISESPWSASVSEVMDAFCACPDGLTGETARERLLQYGPNQIAISERISPWKLLLRQFRSLIVALLVSAAIVSALVGDWVEAIAVLAVVVINALVGFFTEWKANRSMDALKNLTQ